MQTTLQNNNLQFFEKQNQVKILEDEIFDLKLTINDLTKELEKN